MNRDYFLATSKLFNSVSDLLPHRGDMILLDHIESWGEDYLEAVVLHHGGSLFSDPDGNVPAWVGIEYMAQAISALAGIHALQNGKPVRIGLLLGTRKYATQVANFRRNTRITVKVEQIFMDENNLAAFDCTIHSDRLLAEAQIKAIQPNNIEDIIKSS